MNESPQACVDGEDNCPKKGGEYVYSNDLIWDYFPWGNNKVPYGRFYSFILFLFSALYLPWIRACYDLGGLGQNARIL